MVAPWITKEDVAFPESLYADTAIEYASYVLYRLTGEKYPGITRTKETYVHERNGAQASDPATRQALVGLNIISLPYTLRNPDRLYLRGNPVTQVHSVVQNGEVLDPSTYTLYNHRFIKMDYPADWRSLCSCQDGVDVDYSFGANPPAAGRLAASTLANELLILLGEGQSMACRIPERVRSVSREGISFDMIDPQEFMDDGRTGIWEVDLFIRTANPARAKKQPRLLSPNDAQRYRR